MATKPLDDPAVSAPAIDNEITTYRAISAPAVTSLILGFLSIFCFTSLWFLVLMAVAVAFGVLALARIKRLPDILTGAGFARAGIGLALLFGLTAATQVTVEYLMIDYEASQFAKQYTDILRDKPMPLAVWYMQPVEYRKSKTPDEIVAEMKKRSSSGIDAFAEQTHGISDVQSTLKEKGSALNFVKIESQLADGLIQYANALLDVDAAGKEQFALVELVKMPKMAWGDWQVRSIVFPYKPKSMGVSKLKKDDDDGHGHGH